MRFLLDESTEFRLATWLASQGQDVLHNFIVVTEQTVRVR